MHNWNDANPCTVHGKSKLKLSHNTLTDTPAFLQVPAEGPGRVPPRPQEGPLPVPDPGPCLGGAGREPGADQYIRGCDTLGLYSFRVQVWGLKKKNPFVKSVSAYNPEMCTQDFSSVLIIKHSNEL